MKKTLAVVLLSLAVSSASATALGSAESLANGADPRAVMDGGRDAGFVSAAATPGGERGAMTFSSTGADLTPGRAAPPAPESKEPGFFSKVGGFFSKAWDTVKTPTFLVPAGMGLALGAMGAMAAGPLGFITGAAIGGLLGFLFTKAMG